MKRIAQGKKAENAKENFANGMDALNHFNYPQSFNCKASNPRTFFLIYQDIA